jgi:hypothetical protein
MLASFTSPAHAMDRTMGNVISVASSLFSKRSSIYITPSQVFEVDSKDSPQARAMGVFVETCCLDDRHILDFVLHHTEGINDLARNRLLVTPTFG